MLSLLAIVSIALASPQDAALPIVDVKLHAWGVEFVGSDGVTTERDMIVVDPWEFDLAIEDPPTETPEPDIWDCIDAARATCTFGVKRFYFSAGPPVVCEFECYGGTGGGS